MPTSPHLLLPDWWAAVARRACQPPASERAALLIGDQPVGSIALPLLHELARAGLPLAVSADRTRVALLGDPDAAFSAVADWLRRQGHAGRWRNELLSVLAEPGGPVLSVVERGVARNLGIHTVAVQLHARAGRHEAEEGSWWLQQRALDKATDPGKWDTLTGGMVAAGETVAQALARESWEEAGVHLAGLALPPIAAGSFTVRRPVHDSGSHGWQVETVFAYACTVAADQVPSNQDGEVLRFEAFSAERIDAMALEDRLTLEAAVAVALCRRFRA